jgi:hypothetical protein
MKEQGLQPIPVFHQDENLSWLEKMLAEGETYIGLSPKPTNTDNIAAWLDACFDLLKGSSVKTHAFGATSPVILENFPFTSADSSTWREVTMNGSIFAPPSYSMHLRRAYKRIFTTTEKRAERNHVDMLPPSQIEYINDYLTGVIGTNLGRVRYSSEDRMRTGVYYFAGLADTSGVKIYFATNLSQQQKSLLDAYEIENRLLSYAELRQSYQALTYYTGKVRRYTVRDADDAGYAITVLREVGRDFENKIAKRLEKQMERRKRGLL